MSKVKEVKGVADISVINFLDHQGNSYTVMKMYSTTNPLHSMGATVMKNGEFVYDKESLKLAEEALEVDANS